MTDCASFGHNTHLAQPSGVVLVLAGPGGQHGSRNLSFHRGRSIQPRSARHRDTRTAAQGSRFTVWIGRCQRWIAVTVPPVRMVNESENTHGPDELYPGARTSAHTRTAGEADQSREAHLRTCLMCPCHQPADYLQTSHGARHPVPVRVLRPCPWRSAHGAWPSTLLPRCTRLSASPSCRFHACPSRDVWA